MGDRPSMRGRTRLLSLGRFFGVPLYLAPSWLIFAALLTVSYGPHVHSWVTGISTSTAYLTAFVFAVLFALCVLAHELGHTAASLWLGNPVRRVVIFLLGGVSEIEREPERARDEFLIALAGPAVSGVLTGLAVLGRHLLPAHSIAGVLALLLLWANLSVVVFNLLPGLPLDGGRLLRAAVWGLAQSRLTGTRIGAWTGRVLAVAVGGGGLYLSHGAQDVASTFVVVFVAFYLWFGATAALRSGEVLERIPSVELSALLRPGLMVPADISVAEALSRVWAGAARGLVLVDADDRPTAIVAEAQVGDVPPERRPWTPLATVARALEPGLVIPIGLTGEALIDAIRATPASEYLVVNPDGSPAGILAITDLATTLKGAAA